MKSEQEPKREVRTLSLTFEGEPPEYAMVHLPGSSEDRVRLVNPQKTWLEATAGDVVHLQTRKGWTEHVIKHVILYAASPGSELDRFVTSAAAWLDGEDSRPERIRTRDEFDTTELTIIEPVELDGRYSKKEFQRICEGHISQDMDDKWESFAEDNWLYIYRRTVDRPIFKVHFVESDEGYKVEEAIVNVDPEDRQRGRVGSPQQRLELVKRIVDSYAGRPFCDST